MSGAACNRKAAIRRGAGEQVHTPIDLNEEEMSEARSDDSGANDKIRSRRNATRYALFHGPANPRLEMPSTGFEAEDTRSKYGHDDFTSTNF